MVPDPYTAFPMCEIIKATRILAREIGDQVWICGRADQGPMDLASQLIGMEPLMLEIATGEKADLVHRLLDYARRVATRYAFALIESGARSTSIGQPVAGPSCCRRATTGNTRGRTKNAWWMSSRRAASSFTTTSAATRSRSSTNSSPPARRCWRSITRPTCGRPRMPAGARRASSGRSTRRSLRRGRRARSRMRAVGDRHYGAGGWVHPGAGLLAGD